MADFYGPYLKIERAKHHIRDLETIFRDYTRLNVKRFRRNGKAGFLKSHVPHDGPTFPKHASTVLGDAVHNLRAALDHAYHITADAHGARWSDYRKFPFGKDRQSLKGSIDGDKGAGTAPSDAVCDAIINEIEPYEGGKLGLYGLNRLDITDKHIVLIPIQRVMRINQGVTFPGGGSVKGISIIIPDEHKDLEFVGGSGVLHDNPKSVFHICFQDGQPFEGESILEVIKRLWDNTNLALSIIKDRL